MLNIPIYRAKKLDSEEWVEGYLYKLPILRKNDKPYIMISDLVNSVMPSEIDPKTLSIHFPNMVDKNGKKIFASLSEDGVGGDTVKLNVLVDKKEKGSYWEDRTFEVKFENQSFIPSRLRNSEVIGIHKG